MQFYVGRGLDVADPFVTLTVAMSQPASRGSIALRSADPLAPPVIRANYFAEPRDLDAMVEGVAARADRSRASQRVRAAARRRASIPTTRSRIATPMSARSSGRAADTIFHPAGTCRMGRGRRRVVDPSCASAGIGGPARADASIMSRRMLNSQIHAACVE